MVAEDPDSNLTNNCYKKCEKYHQLGGNWATYVTDLTYANQ